MFSCFRVASSCSYRNLCSLKRSISTVTSGLTPRVLLVERRSTWLMPVLRKSSSERKMVVKTSDFLDKKAYDSMHFFVMLGAVPCLLLVVVVNIFYGPAELADIPEGYEPEYWEYYRHPISRFLAKHLMQHPQKVYESTLGQLADKRERAELVKEERWFRKSQRIHGDYRGWYFVPSNPAGVIRGRKEQELDQEIGELVSR